MGKATGFKEYTRELPTKRPVEERLRDYREVYRPFTEDKLRNQAARCMNCGVPTCHAGCPLGNIIPDWNDLVYRDRWKDAIAELHATNNFPEFTGRLCPAPCEEACVLSINEPAVTIEEIEKSIVEHAFAEGWIVPAPPAERTGKTVAVIGSGPAGLACAQQLNRAGHLVTVYERAERPGGLLRYGIPDFKLEKDIVDRRLDLMEQEGIHFENNAFIGKTVPVEKLDAFDAVVLCVGATQGRDMPIPGRDFKGIYMAMDYLPVQNREVTGDKPLPGCAATERAEGKHVIVIGGGDTGSDCIGTANRQRAKSVTNFELLPRPPDERPEGQPWPYYPMRLRTSSSHDEGCERFWRVLTKEFLGEEGHVTGLVTVTVEFVPAADGGRPQMRELPGTEHRWPADMVLLALGFTGPEPDNVISQLGLELDARGNIKTDANYMSGRTGVFAAGDARRGQSLIVWAIAEGREAARAVDLHLMGRGELPTKGEGDLPRV